MDSSEKSVPNAGDSDVESDVSHNGAIKKLPAEDANDWMNKMEPMDQLVPDVTAERDRIGRSSSARRVLPDR